MQAQARAALAGSDAVFLTGSGYPLTSNYVYKIVSQACPEAGIQAKRLGPHTCRHTLARTFLLDGGDLLTLQRIPGHSSLQALKLYVRLDTRDPLTQQRKPSPMDTLRARPAAYVTAWSDPPGYTGSVVLQLVAQAHLMQLYCF